MLSIQKIKKYLDFFDNIVYSIEEAGVILPEPPQKTVRKNGNYSGFCANITSETIRDCEQ